MKMNYIVPVLVVCTVAALGLTLAQTAEQPKSIPLGNVQAMSNSGVEPNSNEPSQAKALAVTNSQPTNVMSFSLPNTNLNALTITNKPEEVFKTVILPAGMYVCTDTGRQTFYFKTKNGGGGYRPVNILEFLHINRDATNVNNKITDIITDGSNVVIYLEGQPHVLKLYGDGGNN